MILFFYILKDYLKYVLGTILLTIFLFILFDFIHKTTREFADHPASTFTIFRFYAFQIPEQFVMGAPIASLLGSVISMILLSRTNEVTAMRAAGMGPSQIALPLATGGMFLSLLSLGINEFVVPPFAQKVHYIQQVQIRGEKGDQISGGAKWVRHGSSLVNFGDYDPISQVLTRVKIVEVRSNFRPVQSIEAERGTYRADTKAWFLQGIRIFFFKRNGTLERVEMRPNQERQLPLEPEKLRKDWRRPMELSSKELNELVERGDQSGADTVPYKVDLHGKLAYPFAAFVVSLIGLKFGYKSERSTETAKGVLIAFFIGISYWFVQSAGHALGLRGDVHPFVAAWLPNVVILSIIGFDAWMSRRL